MVEDGKVVLVEVEDLDGSVKRWGWCSGDVAGEVMSVVGGVAVT